jgi:hypothetical protein
MNYIIIIENIFKKSIAFSGEIMQFPSFVPPYQEAICISDMTFLFPEVRFSLLTATILRIEYSPDGVFEDRPSQVFWYRNQPPPKYSCRQEKESLLLETDFFRMEYRVQPMTRPTDDLRIRIKNSGEDITLNSVNTGLLAGTARTLDEADGPVDLHPGLISRSGWTILDDTHSLVFDKKGWIEPREAPTGYRDFYLFVYGHDYKLALRDYQCISGKAPIIPRTMLGNWWSRFWEYSQEDIKLLVKRFQQEEIPLSAFIIDMDWHITDTGNACSGWTGFSWNRRLFPDPPALLHWLHEHDLITSLNLHPAEGIYPHEERYPQAALALGLNPEVGKPITFEIADPHFARVYFDQLLHPLEEQGVDFWWLDWQQGDCANMPGLDPLWWLNHLHFYDLARDGRKRPVIFSRWGGAGNHRYPIGFSGDSVVSWKSLAFQPYFTATAANCAYGWWSHDIGGHMYGMEDPELYLRWVQFGVLSPIFRLHCTKDPFMHREPWAFDAEILRLTRSAMQFRHALVPYLYTMAHCNWTEGIPVITPLYYEWPEEEAAYLAANQYLLGSQLMAVPVVEPLDHDLNLTRVGIWFPPGEWFHFFNGEHVLGSQWKIQYYNLSDIPLFARAGGIIPIQAETARNGCANPDSIDLVLFPGKDGEFDLYEDDGISQDYIKHGGCITPLRSTWRGHSFSVQIGVPYGETNLIPAQRKYRVLFRGIAKPDEVHSFVDGKLTGLPFIYDQVTSTLILGPVELTINQELEAKIGTKNSSLLSPFSQPENAVDRLLKHCRMETLIKGKISRNINALEADICMLLQGNLDLTRSQMLALIETITDVGAVSIEHPVQGKHRVLFNPGNIPGFKCTRNNEALKIKTTGTIVPGNQGPVEVDYFGMLKVQI